MRRFALAVAVAVALAALGGSTAVAAQGRSVAFAPQAHPFGHSYVHWAEAWANWALGTSVDTNAFVHPDNCGPGSTSDKVWFLAGSFDGTTTADCTMPTGKGLLLSPAGNFCAGAVNGVTTQDALTSCALEGVTTLRDIRVTVDGHRVRHIARYFLVSPVFDLTLEANNLFGVEAQTTPAVIIGDYVMIHPLPPGRHTIVGFVRSTLFPSGFAKVIAHVHVVAHRG
jgi:hypothetical protein